MAKQARKNNRSKNQRSGARSGRSTNRNENYRRDEDNSRESNRSGAAFKQGSESMNDISWYSRYPNLLAAAGSFPFPYRPGMQLPLGELSANLDANGRMTPADARLAEYQVPGVMAMNWIPVTGYSKDATDPPSVAAKEIYARVRQVYSGNLLADAPDYIVYLMCLDSIYAYIAYLKRIYRILTAWSPNNYIVPDGLLGVMGFTSADIENLRRDRMRFFQYINELVFQARKFTCPAIMDIFNRHYWMSDNVYTDAPTPASQMYVFNLVAVHQFCEQDTPDGVPASGTEIVELPHFARQSSSASAITAEDMYEFGVQLIEALVAWDDAYTIDGYLRRAYEGVPTFVVDELRMDEVFTPVYVEEVLQQIENSRGIPFGRYSASTWVSNPFNLYIHQDPKTNAVLCDMQITTYGTAGDYNGQNVVKPWLSIRSDAPTIADSVIATRLQNTCTIESSDSGTPSFDATTLWTINVQAATEVNLGWVLWSENAVNQGGYTNGIDIKSVKVVARTTGAANAADPVADDNLLAIEAFDWHPITVAIKVYHKSPTSTVTSTAVGFILGDVHNITTITFRDLQNLHRVCVLSEFNAYQA